MDSPTFCHGVAGLLQITLRFARDTALPDFQTARDDLITQLVGAHESASLLGFRHVEPQGTRVDQAGLLDGAPGILLVLLAATTRVEPAWDRMFFSRDAMKSLYAPMRSMLLRAPAWPVECYLDAGGYRHRASRCAAAGSGGRQPVPRGRDGTRRGNRDR